APNSRSSARASMASLNGVPVPCAETKSTAEGGTAASASAAPIARTTPPPSRSGAVMCTASPAAPVPRTRAAARAPRRAPCRSSPTPQPCGALPETRPPPLAGERPRNARRGTQRVEAGDDEAAEEIAAPRQHDVGPPGTNPLCSQRDGLGSGRARELRRDDGT